jgi:catechol 2,3-dioxygenase-like lactoylglutathione lyase family enzyme
MSTSEWSQDLPVAHVRIARPTDKLNEVVRFYTEGIGLERIGGFRGHQGYDGEILGLPGINYHLEFTHHVNGSPCPAPTRDNLLVFYIPNENAVSEIVERLRAMEYLPVPPENPYWEKDGITIEDPDGWRVVLMRRSFR